MNNPSNLTQLTSGNILNSDDTNDIIAFNARFVRAGTIRAMGNRPSNISISADALRNACSLGAFDGKPVFIDHADAYDNPSLRNLVAVTESAFFNEDTQSVDGLIKFYDTPDAKIIVSLLFQILEDPNPPDIGLSLVFYPFFQGDVITSINYVESIDLVFQPAADGRILEALQSLSCSPDAATVGSGDGLGGSLRSPSPQPAAPTVPPANLPDVHSQEARPNSAPLTLADARPRSAQGAPAPLDQSTPLTYSTHSVLQENLTMSDLPVSDQSAPSLSDHQEKLKSWLDLTAGFAAHALIKATDLPQASKDRLLSQHYDTPADVSKAIDDEKSYLASLVEDNVITSHAIAPRSPHIQMGMTGYDQLTTAFDAMLDGVKPNNGVKPLTGIREFYNLMSGDFELTGQFHPDRVMFANVDSSTMAGLVANALNKRVVNQFAVYPRWWDNITREEDFQNLQEVKWITLGGIGSMPTVSEGNAYTELYWDDKTETASFVKKGGYLGITLEAIDKDDTRKLRAAPQALALGAFLTLSKAVSAIFTDNSGSGQTLSSDSKTLFHADHDNLGTTALSASAWASTRQLMRDQVEFASPSGSPGPLGSIVAPRFMLVPNELENTALEILGGYSGGSASYIDTNIWADGDTHTSRISSARSRVIVVDLWSDKNDWVAVADPLLYPTIGIAYRYGRAPEIFSVAQPNSGLMFTNDTMPVKVRFFFAVGAMDYRGMFKHKVT